MRVGPSGAASSVISTAHDVDARLRTVRWATAIPLPIAYGATIACQLLLSRVPSQSDSSQSMRHSPPMSMRLGIQGKAPLINTSHKNANVFTLQVAGAGLCAGEKRPPLPPGASRRTEESLSFPFFSGCLLRCLRSRSLSLSPFCASHMDLQARDLISAVRSVFLVGLSRSFSRSWRGEDDFLSSSYDL